MGIPGEFEHQDFLEVMLNINTTAAEINAIGGVHIIEPDEQKLEDRISQGYRFIAYSLDIRMLDSLCRSAVNKVKRIRS